MILLQEFELFFGRTDGGCTDGRTDRRGSRNSYLDERLMQKWMILLHFWGDFSSFVKDPFIRENAKKLVFEKNCNKSFQFQ